MNFLFVRRIDTAKEIFGIHCCSVSFFAVVVSGTTFFFLLLGSFVSVWVWFCLISLQGIDVMLHATTHFFEESGGGGIGYDDSTHSSIIGEIGCIA